MSEITRLQGALGLAVMIPPVRMDGVDRLVRDGMVAVVYSPSYGAGWSTWNEKMREFLALDIGIALAVEARDWEAVRLRVEAHPLSGNAYLGGMDDLTIEWVPQGTAFRIHEYDGSESVQGVADMDLFLA